MNSFVKKIAIVMPLALAASIATVLPAQAAVPTITVSVDSVNDTNANTTAGAAVVTVPADNKVDAEDAVKFALTNVDANTTINVLGSKALIVGALHTTNAPVTSTSGKNTFSVNVGTGNTAEFFAYTTSTDLASVVISVGGNTFTYYLKATAGSAYNLATSIGAEANTSATVEYSATVTDVFGNAVSGVTPTVTLIGATVDSAATATDSKGVSKFSLKFGSTTGQVAVNVAITATDVDGLAKANKTITKFVNVTDLAADLAAAKAALAAEKAAHEATKAALAKAQTDAKAAQDAAAASLAAAEKALADLKAKFNKLAKKFKFKPVK